MSATVTGLLRADGPHRFRVAGDNNLAGVTDDDLNYSLPSNPITPYDLVLLSRTLLLARAMVRSNLLGMFQLIMEEHRLRIIVLSIIDNGYRVVGI